MKNNQDDYNCFTEEQFAADESFQQWVLETPAADMPFWKSYRLLHPEQREIMDKARLLVAELATRDYSMQPLSPEEKTVMRENIYQSLGLSSTSAITSFSPNGRRNRKRWIAAAAVIMLAIPAYQFILSGVASLANGKSKFSSLIVKTGSGEMKRILLEDSTVVMLNANSSLQCAGSFKNRSRREVVLEGNAFFNVAKDEKHPFVVHAGALEVTVLGTQLNVNARSAATGVELTSGGVKVEQAENKNDAPAYLLPGEKVTFDTASRSLIKTKMNAKLYSAWTEGVWNFRQTTLEEITGLLHEYYGVDIVFKSEKTRRMRINAVMAVTSLQKMIPVIEQTLQIKIEHINNQLILP
jgi:ferric-dicitrate binding protein FerR (iron transport regulator)